MSRDRAIAFLPSQSVDPIGTLTSDTTVYFMVPAAHAFMFKGLVIGQIADADATTGDETIAFSVDYTLDGTNWTAVASETQMDGSATVLEAEGFLQYEPVTLPPNTVAAGLITVVHKETDSINFRVPPDCVVRVVCNVTGTTPVFTNTSVRPFGVWL
jgi:hypothetical protein